MLNASLAILKKTLGVVLLILGIIAIITPVIPGSWLVFIALELLGLRLLFQKKILRWWDRYCRSHSWVPSWLRRKRGK